MNKVPFQTTPAIQQNIIARSSLKLLLLLLQGYRYLISPWLGNHCRFYPSCSAYATEALSHFGIIQGLWMTLRRLLRCHPFHPGGYDPVCCSYEKELPSSPINHSLTATTADLGLADKNET